MKKNHKILISIAIILVVAAIVGGFQVNKTLASNRQQRLIVSDYTSAINLIKDGNYVEARKHLESMKEYKDADIVLKYNNALEESKKSKPNSLLTKMYLDQVPIDYSGDFSKEIKQLHEQSIKIVDDLSKQKELAAKQKKDALINQILELFKKGDYVQASSKAVTDYPILYNYISSK